MHAWVRTSLTWRCFLQHILQLRSQLDNMVRWPGPNDKTVSLITETRLDGGILEPQEMLINDQLLEIG